MTYRLPARFLPPRRYRYPYRRGGRADLAVGLAVAAALVTGLGAKTVTAAHHQGHAPATAVVVTGGETAFITAVLADLGAPDTQADAGSLAAWFPHEYPSWPPWADDNPMSSTLPMPGSWAYNAAGVQNYPSAAEGARATALTLEDGYYPDIVAALRSGGGLCGDSSLAGEFLTWSGGGYQGVC